MAVEEEIESKSEHFESFRKALAPAIEPCEIVTNAAVGAFYQMCFCFSHGVRLRDAQFCKNRIITTVFVGIDMIYIRPESFDLIININSLCVAPPYFKRNNTLFVPRVSSPNRYPLPFFSIKVYISSISIISAVSE